MKNALAAVLIALAAAVIVASPALNAVRGLSIDLLTALRWRVFGNAHPPSASPSVVVAIDEETFRTPPFEGTPSVTWTREIGQVLFNRVKNCLDLSDIAEYRREYVAREATVYLKEVLDRIELPALKDIHWRD